VKEVVNMNKRICCLMVIAVISQLAVPSVWGQENQIFNSEFDILNSASSTGFESWGSYGGTGFTIEAVRDASFSSKNAAVLDVTDAAAATAIGIAQTGLLLEPGVTYPIGFTARAEQDREMVVLVQTNLNNTSWPTQVNEKVNLTTELQDFVLEYTHNGATLGDDATEGVTLYLMLKGAWWPMSGNDQNKKVWVDRVYFGAEPPAARRDQADEPTPSDENPDVNRGTALGWEAGIYADTHDVYLGTNFDDVNTADASNPLGVLVSQGQDVSRTNPMVCWTSARPTTGGWTK
jgi:hypothetical protein